MTYTLFVPSNTYQKVGFFLIKSITPLAHQAKLRTDNTTATLKVGILMKIS